MSKNNASMVIQKHICDSGYYFTVRDRIGMHYAVSPYFDTDGLCHQAALRLIDGIRSGVSILPAADIVPITPTLHGLWPEPAGHN